MRVLFPLDKLIAGIASSLILVISPMRQSAGSPQSKPKPKQEVRHIDISNQPWTGDFDQMLERRIIRVLVPYSRTLYFNDKGHERGITPEMGDIAAGDLSVTEERLKDVDFASPEDIPPVNELIITGPKSPAIHTAEDLSDKTVHVRKSSSYYESLEALNGRFMKEGKPIAEMVLVPDALEDEEMMEMLKAGLLEVIMVFMVRIFRII